MACTFPIANPNQETNQDWVVLATGNQCAVENSQQIVLKSEEAFNKFWEETFSGFDMPPTQASVDFNNRWVVAAFMGMQRKGGFSAEVISLTEKEQSTEILLQHLKPGPDCMSTMAIEFPFLIVSIKKPSSEEISFQVMEKVYTCE